MNCTGLTSISIPSSVTKVFTTAFSGCTGLTSISVDAANSAYDSRDNCNAIIRTENNALIAGCANTVIPSSVTSIGSYAFSDISGLTSLSIPTSVKKIGNSAFSGCTGLTSISIPYSVTSIGESTFSDCTRLSSISIPSSVTSIGGAAFSGCSSLTSITIPSSVTAIEYYVFLGCTGLTSISIPPSVTSIGSGAFSDCTGLNSISIPSSVTSIGSYAFDGCSSNLIIYSESTTPPATSSIENKTVYIPVGTTSCYEEAWGTSNTYIETESETTALHTVKNQHNSSTVSDVYDLQGRPLSCPLNSLSRGIYIRRTAAGTSLIQVK